MKSMRRLCCGILSLAVGLSLSAAPRAEAAVRRAWDVKDAGGGKNPWDFCVNLGQAEEMYTALKKLGVDAVPAIYPNEGHGVPQPRNQVDYHTRAPAWFDKYLK